MEKKEIKNNKKDETKKEVKNSKKNETKKEVKNSEKNETKKEATNIKKNETKKEIKNNEKNETKKEVKNSEKNETKKEVKNSEKNETKKEATNSKKNETKKEIKNNEKNETKKEVKNNKKDETKKEIDIKENIALKNDKNSESILIKRKNISFGIKEMVGVFIFTAIVGFVIGWLFNQNKSNNLLNSYEKELISNYQYILENYYKDINEENLVSFAVKGMLESLEDPYTYYIDEDALDDFNITMYGEYKGIGIQITYNDNNELMIYSVFPNSPAEIKGLQAEDVILKIGGIDVADKTLDEAKKLVASFNDNEFGIVYRRDGQEYKTSIKREIIIIESVEEKYFEKNDTKIGYISLNNFANNSYEQFNTALTNLEKKNIDSLIIDLRNNTGGQLTTVDDIVSLFTNKEDIIYQMKEKNKITKYYSHGESERKYPIVVLVNGASASASELMTAALKDIYGATVIGTRTYGKGTAQEIRGMDNGEQYKFTTKEWLTGSGKSIEGVGIEPTIKVNQPLEYYEEPSESNDAQLQKAIDFLCQ